MKILSYIRISDGLIFYRDGKYFNTEDKSFDHIDIKEFKTSGFLPIYEKKYIKIYSKYFESNRKISEGVIEKLCSKCYLTYEQCECNKYE